MLILCIFIFFCAYFALHALSIALFVTIDNLFVENNQTNMIICCNNHRNLLQEMSNMYYLLL